VIVKANGLLSQIRPILDRLGSQAGFWIDPQLYAKVLRAAGE
jgi:predicted nucleic acid-binding protein